MSKSIAATAGLAVLLAAAVPATAQSSGARLTKSAAAKRLVLQAKKAGGTNVKTRCRAPKRGSAACSVTYRSADGRSCSDERVTVVRRNGRTKVKGFAPLCNAAETPISSDDPVAPIVDQGPDAIELPGTLPDPGEATPSGDSPIFDPGAGAPIGPPPGSLARASSQRPPAAPKSAPRTAIARTSSQNYSFLGCTQWQIDPWYRTWWMYACYWSYSSAPAGAHLIGWQTDYVAQVYYWTGTQAAFWFRSEWTA